MKEFNRFYAKSGYGWSDCSPDKLQKLLIRAGKKVMELKEQLGFTAVVFCGSSGSALGFYLAGTYGLPIIYVKKMSEKAHCSLEVTSTACNIHITKYLIVDDLIDSGDTVRHMVWAIDRKVKNDNLFPAKPVGIFCYDWSQASRTTSEGVTTPYIRFHRHLRVPVFLNYTLEERFAE